MSNVSKCCEAPIFWELQDDIDITSGIPLCEVCGKLQNDCNHEKTVCPEHKGSFDCTPFCAKCEGEQEFCAPCEATTQLHEAVKMVTEHLTDINAHTLVKMIDFQFFGCEDEVKYEVMSMTYEVAKNFLYSGNQEVLGRK